MRLFVVCLISLVLAVAASKPACATGVALDTDLAISSALPLDFPDGTDGFAAIGFDGQYLWAAKWASDVILRYTLAGAYVDSFSIPGVTGTRGMTWDGTHLWLATNSTTLHRIDPATRTRVATLQVPLDARYLTYDATADAGAGGFWIGNFSTDILLVDMDGTVLQTLPAATIGLTARYGLALDTTAEAEPFLWVFDQSGPHTASLGIIDLPEGTVRPGMQDLHVLAPDPGVHQSLAGGLYLSNGQQAGMPKLLALNQVSWNNRLYILDRIETYTIGGTVSGLAGSGLVLQNNGADDLPIASNGSFVFPMQMADGGAYAVTVSALPATPTHACQVSDGAGNVAAANVATVAVVCTTNAFTVGGTVGGLVGTGLVLQNNGRDDLQIAADGSFTFSTPVDDLSPYAVTVLSQPGDPSQTCMVDAGEGDIAGDNVIDVAVTCSTDRFTVGGTIAGLLGGGLVLQNNGGDDLAIAADGSFTFVTAIDDGDAYAVTVASHPSLPAQSCAVTDGSGTLDGAAADDVFVFCTTYVFALNIVSGSGQSADLGTGFTDALTVSLTDGNGDPVPEVAVTFEGPATGAGATLDDGVQPPATSLAVETNAAGEASVLATANDNAGCYGVVAAATGAPASVAFELTNVDPVPPGSNLFEDGFETTPAAAKGLAVCFD